MRLIVVFYSHSGVGCNYVVVFVDDIFQKNKTTPLPSFSEKKRPQKTSILLEKVSNIGIN